MDGVASGKGGGVSTWGWVFPYGLTALLFLICLSALIYLWGQERWVRWQDHRDGRREARDKESGIDPER